MNQLMKICDENLENQQNSASFGNKSKIEDSTDNEETLSMSQQRRFNIKDVNYWPSLFIQTKTSHIFL